MFTFNCKGKLWVMDKPAVMGIINATPDSFYSGSRLQTVDAALRKAEQMLGEGAAILDIGGQSTRPGSTSAGIWEEADRVLPVVEAINKKFPACIISIDTYHAGIARQAIDHGAFMVNDISGGLFDADMFDLVAQCKVPYVCMHVKGHAETMHTEAGYENVTQEVLDYFITRLADMEQAGIKDIIIDPGFGFSKTIAHNFQLLKDLPVFSMLRKPLMVGVSRKSTIYKTLGITPAEALNGTTVLNTAALLNGAGILRVHDVKEAVEAIELVRRLQ